MNAVETLEIIKTLHAVGASHFKSSDFEVSLVGGDTFRLQQDAPQAPVPPPQPIPENKEATERLKELIGTMSLSPEALADKIFPAGAER
jgi:hypothetical protein